MYNHAHLEVGGEFQYRVKYGGTHLCHVCLICKQILNIISSLKYDLIDQENFRNVHYYTHTQHNHNS